MKFGWDEQRIEEAQESFASRFPDSTWMIEHYPTIVKTGVVVTLSSIGFTCLTGLYFIGKMAKNVVAK